MVRMTRPNDLARILGLTASGLRGYAREFEEFLSPSAASGTGRAGRRYDATDCRVMSFVAQAKREGKRPDAIRAALSALRDNAWQGLPPLPGAFEPEMDSVEVISASLARERIDGLVREYEARLAALQTERDALLGRLAGLEKDNGELRDRLAEVGRQEAELRGVLSQYTIGGRRLPALVLVAVVALVVIVVLTGLIIILR